MNLLTTTQDITWLDDGPALQVVAGRSAVDALDLASDLTEGIQLLMDRIHDTINETADGQLYGSEAKAIALLAETASALTRSVRISIQQGGSHE